MNILLDIIGSSFIAGIIWLMLFNINVFQTNTRFASDSELQMQQNSKTLAEILNHDLRKIGYECDSTAFVEADSERVSFYSDIDRNGSIDLVTYIVSDTTEAIATPNPRDRVLKRIVNSDTLSGPSLGLIKVKFSYYDPSKTPTNNFSLIRYVKAELWVESIQPIDGEYIFTYWEMTINPRNL
jgi:hypothetical protein